MVTHPLTVSSEDILYVVKELIRHAAYKKTVFNCEY